MICLNREVDLPYIDNKYAMLLQYGNGNRLINDLMVVGSHTHPGYHVVSHINMYSQTQLLNSIIILHVRCPLSFQLSQ